MNRRQLLQSAASATTFLATKGLAAPIAQQAPPPLTVDLATVVHGLEAPAKLQPLLVNGDHYYAGTVPVSLQPGVSLRVSTKHLAETSWASQIPKMSRTALSEGQWSLHYEAGIWYSGAIHATWAGSQFGTEGRAIWESRPCDIRQHWDLSLWLTSLGDTNQNTFIIYVGDKKVAIFIFGPSGAGVRYLLAESVTMGLDNSLLLNNRRYNGSGSIEMRQAGAGSARISPKITLGISTAIAQEEGVLKVETKSNHGRGESGWILHDTVVYARPKPGDEHNLGTGIYAGISTGGFPTGFTPIQRIVAAMR